MTSFTKALYRRDPKAAEAFYRQSQFEHRHTYGRTPTLACFTPEAHGLRQDGRTLPVVGNHDRKFRNGGTR